MVGICGVLTYDAPQNRMKIRQLSTSNIAGLADADLDLSHQNVVAFAGPNGAGKSKLLLCLIAPWLRDIPPTRDKDNPSSVSVGFSFTEDERDVFRRFAEESRWPSETEQDVDFTVIRQPTAGITTQVSTQNPAIENGLRRVEFLKRLPSVDVLFLPAERRFASRGGDAVQLGLLEPEMARQISRDSRAAAFGSAGQLDDSEFEAYAKALCVASYLPKGNGTPGDDDADVGEPVSTKSGWEEFKKSIDRLIDPKKLLPLTSDHPSQLRIELPDGSTHPLSELSSGERQALTIVSRIFRAGETKTLTIIDEPDLHLHPHLGSHLFDIIKPDDTTQLFIATHSAAILDNVSTDSIWEVRHDEPPHALISESERVALYRSAGFRASELTQSELLVLTEGEFDAELLRRCETRLSRAALRPAGGRSEVIRGLQTLLPHKLPVLGVVDADVLADEPPEEVSDFLTVWPTADIEALFLSDRAVLEVMVDSDLTKPGVSVEDLEERLAQLALDMTEAAIAEIAQRILRDATIDWPSPRGDGPIDRLAEAVGGAAALDMTAFEQAIARAKELVEAAESHWKYIRGKYVIGGFTSEMTQMKTGDALLMATATALPQPPAGADSFVNAAVEILGE